MNKQILMDLLVVIVAPICFVAAYHFIMDNEITTDELLAITSPGEVAAPGAESRELGAKSKEILTELKSIRFDESFFSDPAYLSLEDFTPIYETTNIGRDYPFSTPEVVIDLIKRVQSVDAPAKAEVVGAKGTTKSVTPPAAR